MGTAQKKGAAMAGWQLLTFEPRPSCHAASRKRFPILQPLVASMSDIVSLKKMRSI